MKTMMWMVALATVIAIPAMAEDLVNKKEFQIAAEKAGDAGFNTSLAQTARLQEFCGHKDKAQEVRDYLQPVTMVMAGQMFKDVDAGEYSKQSMRGMYLSRAIAASMATEVATVAVLDQVGPLSEAQKTKICKYADEGYKQVMAMRDKARAASAAAKVSSTVPAAVSATSAK